MSSAPQPVLLEVLARVPTDFFPCSHCERMLDVAGIGASVHQEVRTSYPPEMLEQAERLAEWLQDLSTRYGERLRIRVVDAQSLEGFFRSVRHWVREYPGFIINRRATYVGWDRNGLDRLLERETGQRASSDAPGRR